MNNGAESWERDGLYGRGPAIDEERITQKKKSDKDDHNNRKSCLIDFKQSMTVGGIRARDVFWGLAGDL